MGDDELCEVLRAANTRDVRCGDTAKIMRPRKYKEVQIHGEVRLDQHVARLVANERHWPMQSRLEELCKRHGWALSWMDMERSRWEASAMSSPTNRHTGRWRL